MMMNKYPLEWLDFLILQSFNPSKTNVKALSENDLEVISGTVLKETSKVQVRIKNEIFALRKKREIRLLVRKYHSTLIYLLDTIVARHNSKEFQIPNLSIVAELIIQCLDELLAFLENRFSSFLSLDERVPVTYLIVTNKELQIHLSKLKSINLNLDSDHITLKIIQQEINNSLNIKSRSKVTFRQVLYDRDLLKNILQCSYSDHNLTIFSKLDAMLINLNFNSQLYINSLIERILTKISKESSIEKVSMLSLYYKEYSQLNSNEKITFDASQCNIKNILDNWFRHEMAYLEKQIELKIETDQTINIKNDKTDNKLECDLSADQIGLILRAADEARVVKSRSMSMVFQRIVPYLSTAFKKELSYQSVRSKSYNAEENDKNIAIETLEKMIKKIKSY